MHIRQFRVAEVERIPQQSDFPIAEDDALARSVGQLQSQVGDLEVNLPLLLLGLDALWVDVQHHLFFAQFAEQVQELRLHGTENQLGEKVSEHVLTRSYFWT